MFMKKIILITVFFVAIGGGYFYFYQHKQNSVVEQEVEEKIDESDFLHADEFISQEDIGALSEAEKAGVLLMREEEKLARDVYLELGEKWGVQTFTNIAASEQTHMDAMKSLLTVFDVSDPIVDDTRGVFVNGQLASLYAELVDRGSMSKLDALIVGATIEDLDIYDLERLLAQTDKQNIQVTYKNLQKGSRNHLRAFNRQIARNGGIYEPQYISEAQFSEIVNSAQEKGVVR